jgi:hypothetical protein
MDQDLRPGKEPEEDYRGWSLRDRLELLAFDARFARVPPVRASD